MLILKVFVDKWHALKHQFVVSKVLALPAHPVEEWQFVLCFLFFNPFMENVFFSGNKGQGRK